MGIKDGFTDISGFKKGVISAQLECRDAGLCAGNSLNQNGINCDAD